MCKRWDASLYNISPWCHKNRDFELEYRKNQRWIPEPQRLKDQSKKTRSDIIDIIIKNKQNP